MTHPCGCVNGIDHRCGAIKSLLKCEHHKSKQRQVGLLGEDYYRELGALDADAPIRYRSEFEECFGELPQAEQHNRMALEIGGGASPYVPMIAEKRYRYHGIEPSVWAVDWMWTTHPDCIDHMWTVTWDEAYLFPENRFSLILSAHSLEYMADAPTALQKMSDYLAPGGRLYIICPDDTDLVNEDHLWFFNRITLARAVENAGLKVHTVKSAKRIERERFLYCCASK